MEQSKYRLPSKPMVMEITPDMAGDWLETRTYEGNRRISATKVEGLVQIIRAKEFKETHQGIAFDTFGLLIDGQHRLKAVNVSGQTVKMWVFPNMARDTFDVIDTGARRQAGQFMNSRTPGLAAGALRYISAVTERGHLGVWRQKMELHETLELHRQWPELENWGRPVNVVRQYTRINASPLLAVVAMGERGGMSHEDISEFLEGLKIGAISDPRDSRLQLRNRWIRDADNLKGAHKRTQVYALILRAFNLYATGESISRLIYQEGDYIALPHGLTWGGVRIETRRENAA